MRWLCLFSLFLLVSSGSAAQALQAHYLYGKRYVKVDHWAKSENLVLNWRPKQDVARLTNRWQKVNFTVDSQLASINGVNLWLCYPVVARGEAVYIAEKDIEKTLTPILRPVKAKAGQRIRTVAISAGHGGRDPGYVDRSTTEKAQTLLLAKAVRDLLKDAGLNVLMIRDDDRYLLPEAKTAVANRAKADLAIHLHFNSSVPSVKGIEVYCMPPAGTPSTAGQSSNKADPGNAYDHRNVLLAYELQEALMRQVDTVDRGVRRARFIVLREGKMPSVLVEAGFLSNRAEASRITNPKGRAEIALAIHDGIMSYKKLVERGEKTEKLPIPPTGASAKKKAAPKSAAAR